MSNGVSSVSSSSTPVSNASSKGVNGNGNDKDKGNAVNNSNETSNSTAVTAGDNASAADSNASDNAASANKQDTDTAAVYEKSGGEKAAEKQNIDPQKLQQLIDESNKQTERFAKMIEKMFSQQSKKAQQSNDYKSDADFKVTDPNIQAFLDRHAGEQMVDIDDDTRKQAQKDVADGGYYSAEKTSGRILDFAFAYAGDDPKKLDEMKNAFLEGYKQAENQWGGKLPQISQDTYDRVMKGFEDKNKPADTSTTSQDNNNIATNNNV